MTALPAPSHAGAPLHSAFAVVVGLDPGASNVGVCVWLSTASGPDVLEAVTIELDGIGPLAISTAARLAVRTAKEILANNSDRVGAAAAAAGVTVPAPLFCVENLHPPRRQTQQQRAVAQSSKVQNAVLSTGVSLGALLSALHGQHVQVVEPAGWDHRDGGPQVLRGRQPAGWRGRRGSERQHQRSAYFLSVEGLRAWLTAGNEAAPATTTAPAVSTVRNPVPAPRPETGPAAVPGSVAQVLGQTVSSPPTALKPAAAGPEVHCCIDAKHGLPCLHQPDAPPARRLPTRPAEPAPTGNAGSPEQYVTALAAHIRQTYPASPAALLYAAREALAAVPAPAGTTPPDPAELAARAVQEHRVAPLLRLLPDLPTKLAALAAAPRAVGPTPAREDAVGRAI